MTALRAVDSRVDESAKALRRQVVSLTKSFPALPDGTLNKFLLKCTVSV